MPLEYTLRPRRAVRYGGLAVTLAGFAIAWWEPVIGVPLSALMVVLLAWGVAPFELWRHRLVLTQDHICLTAGAWSREVVCIPYGEITFAGGSVAAGDELITIADRRQREYGINAALMPSHADFELVVSTLQEKVCAAKHTTHGSGSVRA